MALLGVIPIVTSVAYFSREREPTYQGKPLRYWIEQNKDNNKAAATAIRTIGTNAISCLLDWVGYEPPTFRPAQDTAGAIIRRLPPSMRTRIPDPVIDWLIKDLAADRANGVPGAFAVLGKSAAAAIPELQRVMQDHTNSNASKRAFYSLQAIDKYMPSVMLERLSDHDPEERASAVYALGHCSEDDPVEMALLAEGIQTPRRMFAISALQMALRDPSESVRSQASYELQKIAPEVLTNTPPQ